MARWGLAVCLTLATAPAVHAGATISLVPDLAGPYAAGAGPTIQVEVFLANDGGDTDHALRFIQLDLNASTAGLVECGSTTDGCVSPPATHSGACPAGTPGGGTVRLWDFFSTPLCSGDPASCGCGHFLEQVFNGPRPNVVSSTYFFTDPANLGENTNAQRILPGDGTPLKIGSLTVIVPQAEGEYLLDVVNAAQTNPDLGGADVRWGFGTNINGEPLTTWRMGSGLSGGQLAIQVGEAGGCPNFVMATPACGSSLPRTQSNVVRLEFDGPLGDVSGCNGVEILELDGSGNDVGLNLAGSFSCSDAGGNTLRIEESGTVLTPETWYRFSYCEATVVYRAVPGDANNDTRNDFGDLSFLFANFPGVGGDDLNDINADGLLDFGDLSAAFAFNGTQAPDQPASPACP